jgi:hypothetical protein
MNDEKTNINMQTFKLPTRKFTKAFTKGNYKNEVQCKVGMQVRMLELSSRKKNRTTKK